MGVGSRMIPSNETKDGSDRSVVYRSDSEQVEPDREGFGSTLATPELDSAMGVGSQIILSKEPEDESEDVYRQVKELVDEPVASGSTGEPLKSNPKIGMRLGMKKGSKSRIHDSRVYSYDKLIEYCPKRDDSDDDIFFRKKVTRRLLHLVNKSIVCLLISSFCWIGEERNLTDWNFWNFSEIEGFCLTDNNKALMDQRKF